MLHKPYYSRTRLLYEGITRHRIFLTLMGFLIYGLMQSINDSFLSKLPTAFLEGNISEMLLKYLLILVIWVSSEVLIDVTQPLLTEEYECGTRQLYFRVMNDTRPEILKKHNTGYISGLVDKFANHRTEMGHRLLELPMYVMYLAFLTVMLAQYHILYALLLLGILVVSTVIRTVFNVVGVQSAINLTNQESEHVSRFIDSGSNIGTVQKMQSFGFMHKRLTDQEQLCIAGVKRESRVHETGFMAQKICIFTFCPIALLIYMNTELQSGTPLEFAAYVGMVQIRLIHNSRIFADLIKRWAKYSGSFRKLNSILNTGGKRLPLYDGTFSTTSIKNLDYSYDRKDAETKSSRRIRVQIPDFTVDKGDVICIHGESGQGKTTLLNILSGEIENSSVYINGSPASSRLSCVFISQDTEIFDMSLRDNIKMGNDSITDSDIEDIMKEVGLWDWYIRQDDGLDTRLGERGVFVSTGQRQRLNLIRGLLIGDKEIYLLDEPTSNVDEATEAKMIEVIRKRLEGKTVIIVTHRPSIMSICNKAYKFEDGVLHEEPVPKK